MIVRKDEIKETVNKKAEKELMQSNDKGLSKNHLPCSQTICTSKASNYLKYGKKRQRIEAKKERLGSDDVVSFKIVMDHHQLLSNSKTLPNFVYFIVLLTQQIEFIQYVVLVMKNGVSLIVGCCSLTV